MTMFWQQQTYLEQGFEFAPNKNVFVICLLKTPQTPVITRSQRRKEIDNRGVFQYFDLENQTSELREI